MNTSAGKPHISFQHLLQQLKSMQRIRRFEEKCAELYAHQKIRGFLHLYIGEEAVAVGTMAALTPEDSVVATYREHGHALARGIPMKTVMAEMYGKANGCSKGRGGSMHIFDEKRNFYGGNAIVGGGLPMSVGLALAHKKLHPPALCAAFFGEGAVAEGEFHESLNLAALWQLPVLFVCENNRYAMGTALDLSESERNIAEKATAYGIESRQVDGMSVFEIEAAAVEAANFVRDHSKPYFLECLTYRFRGHSMFDSQLYRNKEEVKEWEDKGPIKILTQWLIDNHKLDEDEINKIEDEISIELNESSTLR